MVASGAVKRPILEPREWMIILLQKIKNNAKDIGTDIKKILKLVITPEQVIYHIIFCGEILQVGKRILLRIKGDLI